MESTILATIRQICEEKNISMEAVIETIEHALAAAYRKDFGEKNQNVKVEFNPETGGMKVFDIKTVVEKPEEGEADAEGEEGQETAERSPLRGGGKEENNSNEAAAGAESEGQEDKKRFNPKTEIAIEEAEKITKGAKIGDIIKTPLEVPAEFGRMAAQTAKQVIIQRLREAERDVIFKEFKDREGNVVSGVIQRREGKIVLVDLNRITGVLPLDQQIERENYIPGQKLKFFILSVNQGPRGPEIILSRTNSEIVKELFSLEIPEIAEGTVVIKVISREAGSRSKIAVASIQENIDPIGSCIGQKGSRIQTIISELSGEKIDIIEYDDDPAKFISKALSPAKISSVKINGQEKTALVKVKEDQFSLAIGKGGQNVRLAAQLTGWKINIEAEKNKVEKESSAEAFGDKEAATTPPETGNVGQKNEGAEKKDGGMEKPEKEKKIKRKKEKKEEGEKKEKKEKKPKKKSSPGKNAKKKEKGN